MRPNRCSLLPGLAPSLAPSLTLSLAWLALLGAGPAAAQALADPTRPMATPSGDASTPRAAGAALAASAPAAPALQLQSVQVPHNGPANALLDGQVVRVGDRVGALTVHAIDSDGLTLRGARGLQRLALVNGIAKVASSNALAGHAPAEPPRTLAAGAMKDTR